MSTFRDLKVYQKAFKLAMDIFNLTKSFPDKEKYGLTSQIRRSSRSVCSSIAEAYRKRKYLHILFQKPQMQIWKILKHKCGWIFH